MICAFPFIKGIAMRLFLSLFSVFFVITFSSTIYAQSNKSDLFDGCMAHNKNKAYCNCALGKPYDELVSKNADQKIGRLTSELGILKNQYKKLYDQDMSKGGLNPAQIDRICNIVDEYYQFMEENGLPYKKVGRRNLISSGSKDVTPITNELRQAMNSKRNEINKKIHDLNNEYQHAGALGSYSTLNGGVCYVRNQIKWVKEEIEKQKTEGQSVTTNIGLRELLVYSQKSCGNLE